MENLARITPNRKFKRDYDRLFRKDPPAANVFLLLCELADERGQVKTDEAELARLMAARFENPRAYQLPGGPKR
jgi:hypothetical protein